MIYQVIFERKITERATVRVEAASEDEAWNLAAAMPCEWAALDPDPTVNTVTVLPMN